MFPLRSLLRSTRFPALRPAARPQPLRTQFERPYHVYTRPASLGGRIWFRADGSPRSKLHGLITTSVLSIFVYTTWVAAVLVDEFEQRHYWLCTLVYIQRVDYDYATVSFDDFDVALAYFVELARYYAEVDVSPELLAGFFRSIPNFSQRDAVHGIVRDAAAAVHDVLAQSKDADPTRTAVRVINLVDAAMMALIKHGEDDNADETLLRVQQLREQVKDSAKSYEILG